MLEVAEQLTKRPRTWRPMVLWTAGILLALGLAWFVGAVVVPYFQVRSVVHEYELASDSKLRIRLGPPRQAARKLSVYLRLSSLFPGEREFRETATHYLGRAGGETAVPALVKTLEDSDMGVRRYAALALGEIGPVACEAVPALAVALRDSDEDVRYAAVGALGRIGPAASAAVPALAVALKDSAVAVQRSAAESLGQIGPGAGEAVPALVEALKKGPDEPLRACAAQALGEIGPGAAEAIPALRAVLSDLNRDEYVLSAAAEALKKIRGEEGPKAQEPEGQAREVGDVVSKAYDLSRANDLYRASRELYLRAQSDEANRSKHLPEAAAKFREAAKLYSEALAKDPNNADLEQRVIDCNRLAYPQQPRPTFE